MAASFPSGPLTYSPAARAPIWDWTWALGLSQVAIRNDSTPWSLRTLPFPLPYTFALRNTATPLLGRDADEESSRPDGGCFHMNKYDMIWNKIRHDLEKEASTDGGKS